MDIDSVLTKEEFENMRDFSYERFSGVIIKLVKLSVEESLKSLPSVMTHLSSQAAYLQALSVDFYDKNKDLNTEPNRKIMAQTIENMEGNNPGKTYEEILKLAAPKARDIISKINQTVEHKNVDIKTFESHLGKL